ncbi:cytochrome P450 [Pseudaminobacter sp. 19-2017]|uniref:Cytochrome P450 n=1 Tax=Pseudaminobacter soli (ex Zhang et al. 2022) TaxID=2831468 RepID=A0A942DX79_9HYPH|nr:cytochrome P450 [Pseudaminobacter soli]MBS3648637.1 cytochrome P450 [Pseudaminobacter soli]
MRYVSGKLLERWLIVADLPRRKLALSNDPKVVETVMLDRGGVFPKSDVVHDLLVPLIGEGVFGQPGGTRVKETRRIFSRSLATIPDEVMRAVTERLTREYVDRWLRSPGGRVGISEEFSRLTVDVVSEVTLGDRFSEEESIRFTRLFFEYHKKAAALLLMIAHDDVTTRARIIREMGLSPIGAEMRELMLRRFVKPILTGARPLESAPFALALAQSGRMSEGAEGEQALLDEIAVMLLAGHETTASTLSWLASELAGRSDLQDTAAMALSGKSAPGGYWREASPEAVADALAKEALRLYPPIGFFLRETREEAVFRGKQVPAKSFFVIAPWTLHRHRSLWSRPDEFAPMRWLDGSPAPARTSYMPFGLGARICPGARFAAVEMETILRGLLPRARLTLSPGKRAKPLGNLTSRPDREIVLGISERRRADG